MDLQILNDMIVVEDEYHLAGHVSQVVDQQGEQRLDRRRLRRLEQGKHRIAKLAVSLLQGRYQGVKKTARFVVAGIQAGRSSWCNQLLMRVVLPKPGGAETRVNLRLKRPSAVCSRSLSLLSSCSRWICAGRNEGICSFVCKMTPVMG